MQYPDRGWTILVISLLSLAYFASYLFINWKSPPPLQDSAHSDWRLQSQNEAISWRSEEILPKYWWSERLFIFLWHKTAACFLDQGRRCGFTITQLRFSIADREYWHGVTSNIPSISDEHNMSVAGHDRLVRDLTIREQIENNSLVPRHCHEMLLCSTLVSSRYIPSAIRVPHAFTQVLGANHRHHSGQSLPTISL